MPDEHPFPPLSDQDAKLLSIHQDVWPKRGLLGTWLGQYCPTTPEGKDIIDGQILLVRMNRRATMYQHNYFIDKTAQQIVEEVKDSRMWPLRLASSAVLKQHTKLRAHLSNRKQEDAAIAYIYLKQQELMETYPAVRDFMDEVTNGKKMRMGEPVQYLTWTQLVIQARRLFAAVRPASTRKRRPRRISQRPDGLSSKEWARERRRREVFRNKLTAELAELFVDGNGVIGINDLRAFIRQHVSFPEDNDTPERDWLVNAFSHCLRDGYGDRQH